MQVSNPFTSPRFPAEIGALGAVIKREWIIFIRYPSWIIALIIWPIIFPAIYIVTARALAGPDNIGMAAFTQNTGSADYIGFLVVGTTIWMWQNIVLWDVGFSLRREQMRGTLESNWLSPSWRFSYLLGNSAVQFVTVFLFILATVLEFWLFFGVQFNGNPLLILLIFLVSIPPIYGIGISFASLVINIREANAFVFLVRGLVMVFCGVSYPLSILPGWMQSVAQWLPQSYIIRALREASLNGAGFSELAPDILKLLGFGLFWVTAGYLIFKYMERRARSTGAIGQY